MAGGAVRIGLDALVAPGAQGVPWDLLAINVLGAAVLGWLDGRIQVRGQVWWQPLVGTGMLGGFTTFSSISALAWSQQTASPSLAVLALTVTLVGAAGAAVTARRLAVAKTGGTS